VILTNTSTPPYGGAGVNGDANMVLDTVSFDLGDVSITGGSVALNAGSSVVKRDGGAWTPVTTGYDLNNEFGFSNTGVGKSGPGVVVGALNALTAHSGGGAAVTRFGGGSGLPGGLNYGLVAAGSSPFGGQNFILNSVVFTLNISADLLDLSFLQNGSYIEFG